MEFTRLTLQNILSHFTYTRLGKRKMRMCRLKTINARRDSMQPITPRKVEVELAEHTVSEAQLEHVVIFWGGDCFTTLAGLPDKCVLFIFFHVVVRTWRDWSASRCVLILSSPHHDVWYVRFAPLHKHSKTKFSVCVCVLLNVWSLIQSVIPLS